MIAWKALGPDRWPWHGGLGQWPPPGEWLTVEPPLIPCKHGIHLCRRQDIVYWLAPEIWEAEYDGVPCAYENKIIVSRARLIRRMDAWNDRTARLFACDCAERVLPIWEKKHPEDTRPGEAIALARRFAEGQATIKDLPAASEAAWVASIHADGYAARDVARAASWTAAPALGGHVVWSAVWYAMRAVAKNRTRARERAWQTRRFWEIVEAKP